MRFIARSVSCPWPAYLGDWVGGSGQYPVLVLVGGVGRRLPLSCPVLGCYPSSVWDYPCPVLSWGCYPSSAWGNTPRQDQARTRGHLICKQTNELKTRTVNILREFDKFGHFYLELFFCATQKSSLLVNKPVYLICCFSLVS